MVSRALPVIFFLCFGNVSIWPNCVSVGANTACLVANGTGYGFELLMTKLNQLQHSVLELDRGAQRLAELITQSQHHLESVVRSLHAVSMGPLDRAVAQNVTNSGQQIACNATAHEQNANPEPSAALGGTGGAPFRSCKDVPTKVSGKYLLQPRGTAGEPAFVAYCEQTKFGGGWLVWQRRFDGTLNFSRQWQEYREGFGSADGEYWMGLERLHQLTASGRSVELLVEMEDFAGWYGFARYQPFAIGSEGEQYALKELGAYRGTAGDSLRSHKGMRFTTVDRDNDLSGGNCAVHHGGGWWFTNCLLANLNGLYWNHTVWSAIIWHGFRNSHQGLAYTRLMIREVD